MTGNESAVELLSWPVKGTLGDCGDSSPPTENATAEGQLMRSQAALCVSFLMTIQIR